MFYCLLLLDCCFKYDETKNTKTPKVSLLAPMGAAPCRADSGKNGLQIHPEPFASKIPEPNFGMLFVLLLAKVTISRK